VELPANEDVPADKAPPDRTDRATDNEPSIDELFLTVRHELKEAEDAIDRHESV
jgi:hypothetical protein